MDTKISQVPFRRSKHFPDLDLYLQHRRDKLTTTFLDLLDNTNGINLWVAVYLR